MSAVTMHQGKWKHRFKLPIREAFQKWIVLILSTKFWRNYIVSLTQWWHLFAGYRSAVNTEAETATHACPAPIEGLPCAQEIVWVSPQKRRRTSPPWYVATWCVYWHAYMRVCEAVTIHCFLGGRGSVGPQEVTAQKGERRGGRGDQGECNGLFTIYWPAVHPLPVMWPAAGFWLALQMKTGTGMAEPAAGEPLRNVKEVHIKQARVFVAPMAVFTVSLQKRRQACGLCTACLRKDCGDCIYCRDMRKFGGPSTKRQKCVHRRCLVVVSFCLSEGITQDLHHHVVWSDETLSSSLMSDSLNLNFKLNPFAVEMFF